jgi:hypothetical protein
MGGTTIFYTAGIKTGVTPLKLITHPEEISFPNLCLVRTSDNAPLTGEPHHEDVDPLPS